MKSLDNPNNYSKQKCTSLPNSQLVNNIPLQSSQLPSYLCTQQAAQYLQVSTQWLEIGRVKGYGPPYIKLSRMVRYKTSDLDEWMSNHRQGNTLEGKVGGRK